MDISDEITPKKSLGGISLGEDIVDVISRLSSNYVIQLGEYSTTVNGGLITAYHNEAGIISALSCNSNFKGKYLHKLWPGMTVSEVLKNSSWQVAWCGFVEIDNFDGIGLSLPDDRDDFERLTDHLDENHVFEELWIYR